MNQPLYTEQDNNELNAQVEAKVYARGQTSISTCVDEACYFEVIDETLVNRDTTISPPIESLTSNSKSPPPPHDTTGHKLSFTEGGITVNDNAIPEMTISPEAIRLAQAQLGNGGAVVLGADGNSQMFNNIKDIFANNKTPVKKNETFFTAGKVKIQFGIDGTIFEPTPIVRLSNKSFEQKYLAQLEGYIFNTQDELDGDKLIALIHLTSFIKQGHFPVRLVTGKYRFQLPKITATLNTFFNKNYAVLTGILTMFSGVQQPHPQTEQK